MKSLSTLNITRCQRIPIRGIKMPTVTVYLSVMIIHFPTGRFLWRSINRKKTSFQVLFPRLVIFDVSILQVNVPALFSDEERLVLAEGAEFGLEYWTGVNRVGWCIWAAPLDLYLLWDLTIWGSVVLLLQSPRGGCNSTSDDFSCYYFDWNILHFYFVDIWPFWWTGYTYFSTFDTK